MPFVRLFASLDVTVVDETCLLPEERLPLEEPKTRNPVNSARDERLGEIYLKN